MMLDAARDGDSERLRELIAAGYDVNASVEEEYPVNFRDVHLGKSPLIHAAERGHLVCAQLLIQAGADVNLRLLDHECGTPLIHAVHHGDLEVVALLVEAGADLNAGGLGSTPLLMAIDDGWLQGISFLVINGADVNWSEGFSGKTPLLFAVERGTLQCVELLLQLHADVDKTDQHGMTADRAREVFRSGIGGQNFTPLHAACENEISIEFARALVHAGADLNARAKCDMTPLHIAARYHRFDLVEFLVNAGADVDVVDDRGRAPLLWFIRYQALGERRISMLTSERSDFAMTTQFEPFTGLFEVLRCLVPSYAAKSSGAMKNYYLRPARWVKFLHFALGNHVRAGSGSPVQVLIADVMGMIYRAMSDIE